MLEPDGSTYVQSLARGLAVIRAFGAERPRLSLSDVARATDLTRASARRFLLTLESEGYVRARDGMFELTPRVLELGFSYLSAQSLPEVAQPHLEALSHAVGESSSASILDGWDIVYIARVPTRRIMSVGITIGTRFPAYVTSMGRVLLAALSAAELDTFFEGFRGEAFTARTIVDAGALRAELDRVADQGWSLVDGELETGLRALAVPVARGPATVAAINVSMPATGEDPTEQALRLLAAMQESAAAISRDLDLTG
ncbi:IclR family transcriptional regulator C-terminal domain-containing protein [Pseudolysinimonas yzui]|uniref:Glycerol operon regulatory protein n=1 Tax=Pseudolysinimonas yzui TaxID=2708254 RepID=A0A8J3M431_9MICO|nr:IclR family transcriptional regulator C-terminal domain-containing protein [Pseudolysinimonas yzui]GHF14762.1 transcriptional regulator [Pseudolysinimonas yzui]